MSTAEIMFIIALLVVAVSIEIMSISMMVDIYRFKKMIRKEQKDLYEAVKRIQVDRLKRIIKE